MTATGARGSREVGMSMNLSDREIEVLKLLAEGHAAKEIAYRLGIRYQTTKTHQGNISKKLGLRGKVQLTHYAIRAGIITVPVDQ